MTKLQASFVALLVVCIIQASFISLLFQSRRTWVKEARRSYDIAQICVASTRSDVAALITKMNEDTQTLLTQGPVALAADQTP